MPRAVAFAVVSPDGRNLYVAQGFLGGGGVARYDLGADGRPTGAPTVTALGATPGVLAITPDGTSLYVSVPGSGIHQFARGADGTLTPRTPAVVVGGSYRSLAVTPDGDHLYGTSTSGNVAQFRIDDGRLTPLTPASITLATPSGTPLLDAIRIHPDGDSAWVVESNGPRIHQLDVGPDGRLAPKGGGAAAIDPAGTTPRSLAVTPQADLALTQAAVPVPGAEGEELDLVLSATNLEGTPATGVQVTTTLPADLTFVSATAPGGTCTGSGTVTCSLPWIAEGATRTATIRVRAVRAGTVNLTASASALQPDPVPGDNTAVTSTVTVEPRPGATTAPAGGVSPSGATLNGVVVPAGTNTTYRFELGTSTAYGMPTAAARTAGAGSGGRVVSEELSGLSPDTVYHYRLVVTNDQGATVRGADMTFRTAKTPPPPPDPVTIRETVRVEVPVPAPAPPAPPAVDRRAPVVSRVALTPTRLTLRISEAATVRATIAVRQTRRVRSGGRRRTVTSWRTVRRVTATTPNAGGVSVRLDKRLAAGRYRVTVVATDAAGNASRPLTRSASLAKSRRR